MDVCLSCLINKCLLLKIALLEACACLAFNVERSVNTDKLKPAQLLSSVAFDIIKVSSARAATKDVQLYQKLIDLGSAWVSLNMVSYGYQEDPCWNIFFSCIQVCQVCQTPADDENLH